MQVWYKETVELLEAVVGTSDGAERGGCVFMLVSGTPFTTSGGVLFEGVILLVPTKELFRLLDCANADLDGEGDVALLKSLEENKESWSLPREVV